MTERADDRRWTYQPSLDGLRAVAVVAVLVYHSDERWLPGGFLGVSVFFTLSGFLITSLLLDEWRRTREIDLRRFWSRRFRRLLPASWLTIGLVVALGAAGVWDDDQRRDLFGDALAALGELANWRFVARGDDYGAASSAPSPLQHLWSLAVEQQFYVALPLLVAGVLAAARRRRLAAPVAVLGGGLAMLAIASSTLAATLSTGDVERAYFGTDSRAAEMLVGAVLATAVHGRLRDGRLGTRLGAGGRRLVDAATLGAFAALLGTAHVGSRWLYPWGLLACAAGTAAIIVRSLHGSATRRVLARGPLVALGRISYGVYLLHWPVFLALTPSRTGVDGVALMAARVTVTLAAAVALFTLVEQPIRTGRRLRGATVVPVAAVSAVALVGASVWVHHGSAPEPDYLRPRPVGDLHVAEPSTTAAGTTAAPTDATATSPPATSPPDTTAPRRPTRILLVGDSVAASLEEPLVDALVRSDVAAASAAAAGCGVITGFPTDEAGRISEMTRPCDGAVPTRQSGAVAMFRPDLVAVLSSWEIANRSVDGVWYRVGTPESDAMLRRLYDEMIERLSSGGAVVALVLMPDAVDGRTQSVRPEEVDRNRHLNALLADIADGRWGVVAVPFHRTVCPDDPCPTVVGGIELRERDGRHFDGAASTWAAHRLAELLVAVDLDRTERS